MAPGWVPEGWGPRWPPWHPRPGRGSPQGGRWAGGGCRKQINQMSNVGQPHLAAPVAAGLRCLPQPLQPLPTLRTHIRGGCGSILRGQRGLGLAEGLLPSLKPGGALVPTGTRLASDLSFGTQQFSPL